MSRAAKAHKSKATEPKPAVSVLFASPAPPTNADDAAKQKGATTPAATKATPPGEIVAVVELGEAGEIIGARDECHAIFGWEPVALVGQNIRVLLKRGLDNDLGRFLHRHREGTNPTGTSDLRVQALRKDGSEFPAQVTTLTWNWDTTMTKKGDTSRLCWTAAFRNLGPALPTATPANPSAQVAAGKTVPSGPEPAATATSPVPLAPLSPAPVSPSPISPTPVSPAPVSPAPNPNQTGQTDGRTPEPAAGPEAKQRIGELEDQLDKATRELATVKTDATNLGCRASELRVELDAAKEAAGYQEAALREEISRREKVEERLQNLSNSLRREQAERSKRFEEELIGLRQERDELNSKLAAEQQGAGESTRRARDLEALLGRNAADFEHAKAELEKQTAERARSESSWREQLDTACIAKKELEGAWAGAVERNKLFEEELAKLRREHDELHQRLETEQKAAADSEQRASEVASRLSRNAAASDRARAELEKENAERERADAEWREQLDAAKALKTRLETSLAEATERNRRTEEELAGLRREHDESNRQLAAERITAAEAERARAELEKENAEWMRAEAERNEKLEAAKALSIRLETSLAEATERSKRSDEELAGLRQERDDLNARLATDRQGSGDSTGRAEELEARLKRTTADFEEAKAALEKQTAECDRLESSWREQLDAARTAKKELEGGIL